MLGCLFTQELSSNVAFLEKYSTDSRGESTLQGFSQWSSKCTRFLLGRKKFYGRRKRENMYVPNISAYLIFSWVFLLSRHFFYSIFTVILFLGLQCSSKRMYVLQFLFLTGTVYRAGNLTSILNEFIVRTLSLQKRQVPS